MPVITEADDKGNLKPAETSKDSGVQDQKAKVEHHQANPGPVMTSQDLGPKATKEELKKRAEELNK